MRGLQTAGSGGTRFVFGSRRASLPMTKPRPIGPDVAPGERREDGQADKEDASGKLIARVADDLARVLAEHRLPPLAVESGLCALPL